MKKKNIKNTALSAFTLIELLVVIAIIGILAGLLFPAISGALLKANGIKVGNNGKNIVLGIIAANTEREAMSKGSVWPTKQANYTDSNNYFYKLLDKNVLSVGLSTFAGGGVSAASDKNELRTKGCIWNVIAGLGDNAADETPFLFTRNFQVTAGDITTALEQEEKPWNDSAHFNANFPKPFGEAMVVTVSKGGAMLSLQNKYITDHAFMNGVVNTNLTSDLIMILESAGETASSESEF